MLALFPLLKDAIRFSVVGASSGHSRDSGDLLSGKADSVLHWTEGTFVNTQPIK